MAGCITSSSRVTACRYNNNLALFVLWLTTDRHTRAHIETLFLIELWLNWVPSRFGQGTLSTYLCSALSRVRKKISFSFPTKFDDRGSKIGLVGQSLSNSYVPILYSYSKHSKDAIGRICLTCPTTSATPCKPLTHSLIILASHTCTHRIVGEVAELYTYIHAYCRSVQALAVCGWMG